MIGIINSPYTAFYGFDEGICKMREHGFSGLDYQYFIHTDKEFFKQQDEDFFAAVRAHRAVMEENGITPTQAHAPWAWPSPESQGVDIGVRVAEMKKAIRGTACLGAKNFVIHPFMPTGAVDTDPDYTRSLNRRIFTEELLPLAEELGVTVCLENMPFEGQVLARPADTLAFVREIGHPNLKMCLDTGHVAVFGLSPAEAVRMIGKEYLAVLHVHDNDGRHDYHWWPCTGVVDWADFTAALAEIGFSGCVSLETEVPQCVTGDIREVAERALFDIARAIDYRTKGE